MSTHQDFPSFSTTVPAARQYPQVLSKQDITPTAGNLAMDASQGSVFTVTLTEDVSNWTITNPTDGQEITVIWRQDSTGGWTVAVAADLAGLSAPTTAANSTSAQTFVYDASGVIAGSPPIDGVWYSSESGGGGGATVTFQTDGTDNLSQTTLNLVPGINVTLTNTSGGNVTFDVAGGGFAGVNAQSTNYTAVSGDANKLIAFNTNSSGSYTLVQQALGGTSSVVFGTTPASGTLVIVTCSSTNSSPPSLSGVCSVWTQVQGTENRDDGYYISMFYGLANGSGGTVSVSGLGSFPGADGYNWSGNASSSVLNTSSAVSGGVSNPVGSSVTTTTAGCLIFTFAFDKNGPSSFTTNGGGFTYVPSSGTSNNWKMYGQAGVAGSYEPSVNFGGVSGYAAITGAFAPAAGSALTLLLPNPSPGSSWAIWTNNIGIGTLTVDPNGLDLNASVATVTLNQNEGLFIGSDGTNYFYT